MMSNREAKRAACVLAVVVAAQLWGPVAAQQASPKEPIFRLVTFQAVGDLRLGATEGNGEADIVDIHNAIRALTAASDPQVRTIGILHPLVSAHRQCFHRAPLSRDGTRPE